MSLELRPDGPGTTIVVRDGAKTLPSAPRGTTAFVGQFPSGPTTHAALSTLKSTSRKYFGVPDDNFEASACLDDLYSFYTPPVLVGRVTDGLEVQATQSLWNRKPDRSYLHRDIRDDRAPMASILAHNGGRWGGRKRRFVTGTALTLSAALTTSSTLDLGEALLEDVFADATVTFEGDSGGPYVEC